MLDAKKDITWLGHDGFSLAGKDATVVIDPFQLEKEVGADILLITHAHYDHCSIEDIKKVLKNSTVIVTEPESAAKIKEENIEAEVKIATPGETLRFGETIIETVPAYNVDKKFHPRDNNWLGFIVTLDGTRVYHAGDTDLIPEMDGIRTDIALLPVSGTYVMTADEAVKAVRKIQPKTAVPMHYDAIVGTVEDASRFSDALQGVCEIVIPKKA